MLGEPAARAGMPGAGKTWATCQRDWSPCAMCAQPLLRQSRLLLLLRLSCLHQPSLSAVLSPTCGTSNDPENLISSHTGHQIVLSAH